YVRDGIAGSSALGMKIQLEGNYFTQEVIRSRKPVTMEDAQTNPKIPLELQKEFQRLGVHAIVIFPVIASNVVIGTLGLDIMEENTAFTPEQIRLAETIILQASTALQNARLFEQIQSSESRFRDVSFVSADYVWETDLNWKYTYLSDRVKDVLGYTPTEMLGSSDYDLADVEEAQRVSSLLLKEIANNGQAIDIENTLRAKDGHLVYVSTSAVPVLDRNGDRIGYRGVDKNITERKRTETIQAVLRDITDSALSAPDINTLMRSIHKAVGTLLPAENFYIALYDDKSDLMTFPYYVDKFDDPMPPQKLGHGLTSYVIRTGKPVLATPDVFEDLIKS
ncbi:PAS domain S-box protein, partial [bacterium]|nr:PAS domain S-box protein [bacterium]